MKMQNKNIVMLASIDSTKSNACTLHVSGIANGFSDLGYDVTLLIPKLPKESHSALPLNDNIHVIYFGFKCLAGIPNALKLFFALWPLFQSFAKKPYLFYARFSLFNVIPMMLAKIMKIKSISEHNGLIGEEISMAGGPSFLTPIASFLQLIDCKAADKVRVVTKNLKKIIEQQGIPEHKIFAAGNGTDMKLFRPMNREKCLKQNDLDPNKFYIGFIGTLIKWQGVDTLIQAYEQISSEFKDWHLIIAGSGPEEEKIKELIHEKKLNDSIILTGHVPLGKVPYLFNSFSIGTSPAIEKRNASIGVSTIKIRDYAATKLPILTSRIAGNIELEDQGILMCHKPDNTEDLAQKLRLLISNEQLRKELGEKALAYAKENFNWIDCCRTCLKAIKNN